MAIDPRKRQKKLQRRKAKDRKRKQARAERNPRESIVRLERAATAPILHCCTTHLLWEQGMSNVLLSRTLDGGRVAYAIFLVDMYCLGVKNAMHAFASRRDYDWRVYDKMYANYDAEHLQPAAARKLIEGAVEYARGIGFSPHRDYQEAKLIFGDVDAGACRDEFTYGKDGKPFFFAGPHDSPARCMQIMDTISERLGPDDFDFVLPMKQSTLAAAGVKTPILNADGDPGANG